MIVYFREGKAVKTTFQSNFAKIALAAVCGLALSGIACVKRSDIDEIKKTQETIITKLDEMNKNRPMAPMQRPQGPDPAKVYAVSVDNSAVKGPADAWVTIVEVSDFQCPFCNRVGPTLKEVEQKFGKDVRIVFKHNPLGFHQRALPAAMAAECAHAQGKFWEMHDKLFENQRALADEDLEKYAKEAGVDVAKWKKCYTDGTPKAGIEAEQNQVVSLGARGTPAFFINGRFLSGAQPFPAFEALINEELKKAKDSGIAQAEYYTKAVVEKGEKRM